MIFFALKNPTDSGLQESLNPISYGSRGNTMPTLP